MLSNPHICLRCKGTRNLCGKDKCPVLARFYHQKVAAPKLKENIFGSSPNSIFVGYENYPNVFVGPMVSLESETLSIADTPEKMYGLSLNKILSARCNLVRGKKEKNIFSRDRYIQELQDISISQQPLDIEISFRKKPSFDMSFSSVMQPIGPSGLIKKFKLVDNPKMEQKVCRIVNDDLTADSICVKLYKMKLEQSRISRILSSGILGMEKKLVPTRWSITAVDDILGKNLMSEVRNFDLINDYLVFENEYLHNRFFIILMPAKWEFEQIESWFPQTLWNPSNTPSLSVEYEFHEGRKTYAGKQSGGYYAARFAALDYLYKIKKQAKVLMIREVYSGYDIPLGVWVVRETAKQAFNKAPEKFKSLGEVFNNLKTRFSPEKYKASSEILKQKRLFDFMQG